MKRKTNITSYTSELQDLEKKVEGELAGD